MISIKRSSSAFAVVVILFFNFAKVSGEVLIQDVLWTKEYDEIVGENYFGTCRFFQSPCSNGSDTLKDGVCVQRGKCSGRGGTVSGTNCQDGFGECCMFTEMCDEKRTTVEVNQLVTTLVSPITASTECTFKFRKEINICQIRLDFVNYESAKADEEGNCVTDKLRISNTITVDPSFTTCGSLTGQHMYLTFGSEETIDVRPMLKMSSSKYKIVATKIPCDSKNRAPDYCLQYYTQTDGIVKSFDFGGQQQNNQMYTICVKPTASGISAGIQWKPCTGVHNPFNIITVNHVSPVPCNTDYIQIKGLDKICEPFTTLSSPWKPYEIMVNFDEEELPPPPPAFTVPAPGDTTPDTCPQVCQGMSNAAYACDCNNPADLVCVCIIAALPGGALPVLPDFNNTGFCMEYTQL